MRSLALRFGGAITPRFSGRLRSGLGLGRDAPVDSSGGERLQIPYALADLTALRLPGCLIYAGEGWSPGIRHMLEGSHLAANALPNADLSPGSGTREFDHILAMTFQFWDVVLRGRAPFASETRSEADALSENPDS